MVWLEANHSSILKSLLTLTYAYTPTGKLASAVYPGGARVTNTYDAFGRVTSMQDPLGASSYT
jgi:YD repeat-containing protein